MPNIITKKIKINNAVSFRNDIVSERSIFYMFIGKPNIWPNDTDPPAPIDNQENLARIYDEMIALKRLTPLDVRNVVPRINWNIYQIYDQYDHEDDELFSKKFYVLNSRFDVYKCISNANRKESVAEPFGRSLNIITTSDGYRWKYLYSISAGDQLRFLTNNWMPVLANEEVSRVAKDGAIEHVELFNGGIDYSPFATVQVEGDGKVKANIQVKTRVGVIYDFSYLNPGISYRNARAYVSDPSIGKFANVRAIINPVGGHGYDPIMELGAYYIMLNTKIEYNEGAGKFPTDVKFRQLGVIKNPVDANTANILSIGAARVLKQLDIEKTTGVFSKNEFLEGLTSKANAYVVTANIISNSGIVSFIQSAGLTKNFNNFNLGETVIGKNSGTTGSIKNIIFPEIIEDFGDIIYVDNKSPILRSIDQTETLHLVIEF